MTQYRRFRVPGGTYFFTVRLQERFGHSLIDHVDILRTAYAECLQRYPFQTKCIVILPDHLHAIWTLPRGDEDFSSRWQFLKRRFTQISGLTGAVSPSQAAKGEKGVWQRRFWEHTIRNAADLDLHQRYCWTDPVRHHLSDSPAHWAFSSIHRDMRSSLLDPDEIEPVPDGQFGE
ncbi:REP-associated tyrosine transposase [Tropicibacter alexandrii]|uniref:REP-associated tyrosine transposase n=1 Tax=Tropicibacter alexandrii TaxID=2267683 RepID=UPI000EF470E7|nr:transposase [Tropicibacter alexandrii]